MAVKAIYAVVCDTGAACWNVAHYTSRAAADEHVAVLTRMKPKLYVFQNVQFGVREVPLCDTFDEWRAPTRTLCGGEF